MEQMRYKLEEIDKEIFRLFEERLKIAENIGQHKREKQIDIYDAGQEERKLSILSGEYGTEKKMLLAYEMAISRFVQKKLFCHTKLILPPRKEAAIYGSLADSLINTHKVTINKYRDFESMLKDLHRGEIDKIIKVRETKIDTNDIFLSDRHLEQIINAHLCLSSPSNEIKKEIEKDIVIIEKQVPPFDTEKSNWLLYIKGTTIEDFLVCDQIIRFDTHINTYEIQIMDDLTGQLWIQSDFYATNFEELKAFLHRIQSAMKETYLLYYGAEV